MQILGCILQLYNLKGGAGVSNFFWGGGVRGKKPQIIRLPAAFRRKMLTGGEWQPAGSWLLSTWKVGDPVALGSLSFTEGK